MDWYKLGQEHFRKYKKDRYIDFKDNIYNKDIYQPLHHNEFEAYYTGYKNAKWEYILPYVKSFWDDLYNIFNKHNIHRNGIDSTAFYIKVDKEFYFICEDDIYKYIYGESDEG